MAARGGGKEVVFYGNKQTANMSISFYKKDAELLNWLTEYLGCSKSEAVRSAIKHMAAHIGYLEGHGRK